MGATPYIDGGGFGTTGKLFDRPSLRACQNCGHRHRAAVCPECGLRYDGTFTKPDDDGAHRP